MRVHWVPRRPPWPRWDPQSERQLPSAMGTPPTKHNAEGGRSGDEPVRIARAGDQTLPPGNRVGGHLGDGDDSVGDHHGRPDHGPVPGDAHEQPSESCCWGRCQPRQRTRSPRSAPSRQHTARRHRSRPTRAIRGFAIRKATPIAARRDHHKEIYAPPMLRRRTTRSWRPTTRGVRGWRVGPSPGPCRRGAEPARAGAAAPKAPTRPRLEHRHGDEEGSHRTQDGPSQPGRRPDPIGKRNEEAGGAVEQHRTRRTEQPGQPGREDPTERLAEYPDHETPAEARETAQLGPSAPGYQEQPKADPHLDPHVQPRPPGQGGSSRWSLPH